MSEHIFGTAAPTRPQPVPPRQTAPRTTAAPAGERPGTSTDDIPGQDSARVRLAQDGWTVVRDAGFLCRGRAHELAVLDIASAFGRPSARDGGRAVWSVTPSAHGAGSTFSVRAGAAAFHTDSQYHDLPEDHVCLFVVRPAARGGLTRILHRDGAVAAVRRRPDGRALLSAMNARAWSWTRPAAFTVSDETHPSAPPRPSTLHRVLGEEGSIRWRRDNLDAALPADRLAAADAIAACFDQAAEATLVPLEPGDLLVVDNRRVMHARTWFDDPRRLLLRVRLWEGT